jgi:hypothetical protein
LGGRVVALKGTSAESEVREGAPDAERMGLHGVTVLTLGPAEHPTTVITGLRRAAQ